VIAKLQIGFPIRQKDPNIEVTRNADQGKSKSQFKQKRSQSNKTEFYNNFS